MEEKARGGHKPFWFIIILVAIWLALFCTDIYAVVIKGRLPIFCVETCKGKDHYVGLGYSYDIYGNSVGNEYQYALYVFGKMVKCTFTN